ncbi:1626_t:CDS:2, partial [Racocetra persica]
ASNNLNLLKPGFLYTCDDIGTDNIESSLSVAIKKCYQTIFNTKPEYFEKFSVVIISIGDLDEDKFYGVSTGFILLFTTYYHGAQLLFIFKIDKNQCILKIYWESVCINKNTEETPDKG